MAESSNQGEPTVLPRCYMDVAIEGQMVGRIVFELFSNVCPKTCENFRTLCTGEKSTSQHPLHYKGSPFHRIVKNFMIQGGDFINGNGTGGESIYGHIFADENFTLKHDRDFLLSMANKGPNSNGSQFFILTKPAPHLDGIHVVFGRVVNADGKKIVKMIEAEKADENYRPFHNVTVVNCGELVLLKKQKPDKRKKHESESSKSATSEASSSTNFEPDSESASEQEEKKKHSKEKKKVKKEKSKKKEKSSKKASSSDKAVEEEDDYVCSVRPDEIPPVPSHKFLSRYSSSAVETAIPVQSISGPPPLPPVRRTVAPNAKVVKGRGSFRFNPDRSPSPEDYHGHRSKSDYGRMRSDERSWRHEDRKNDDDEPAHWRAAQQRSIPLEVYQRRMKGRHEREMIQAEREKLMAEQRRREEQMHLQKQLEELEERERERQRREKRRRSRSSSEESRGHHRSRSSSEDRDKLRDKRRGKDEDNEHKKPSQSKSRSKGDESESSSKLKHDRRNSSQQRKSPTSSPSSNDDDDESSNSNNKEKAEINRHSNRSRSRSRSRSQDSSKERTKRRRSRSSSRSRSRHRRSSSSSSTRSSSDDDDKSSSRSRSRDRSWRK